MARAVPPSRPDAPDVRAPDLGAPEEFHTDPEIDAMLESIEIDAPLVAVLMAAVSDLEVMQDAIDELSERGIPYEVSVMSPHAEPDDVRGYALAAEARGLKVIIAGSGKSAALPGFVAAYTVLPVIGVPLRGADLGGLDALLAIAQMPSGVPVATVGVDAARNAAILAARMLRLCWLGPGPTTTTDRPEDR